MRRRILLANDGEFVDLELSVKWAKCNVGASSETEYGNYYQYGKGAKTYQQTSGETAYQGTENPLALTADTAYQVMGEDWRMPTRIELLELTDNTDYSWTTINGVAGGKFTASNGNYVFFPATGFYNLSGGFSDVGAQGYVWSSTPIGSNGTYCFYFNTNYRAVDSRLRRLGCSVRGVCS